MTDTHMLHTAPAPNKCPVAHHDKQAAAAHGPGYGLMRVSQVARDYPSHSALASVLEWMRAFLARSHPELGRKGAVCPFVPVALEQDSIWMAEIAEREPTLDSISRVILYYRDLFLATEPTSGPVNLNSTLPSPSMIKVSGGAETPHSTRLRPFGSVAMAKNGLPSFSR